MAETCTTPSDVHSGRLQRLKKSDLTLITSMGGKASVPRGGRSMASMAYNFSKSLNSDLGHYGFQRDTLVLAARVAKLLLHLHGQMLQWLLYTGETRSRLANHSCNKLWLTMVFVALRNSSKEQRCGNERGQGRKHGS